MQILNDGNRITSTDYWQTEHAARGLLYLSMNAGALRLLVPRASEGMLKLWKRANRAAVQIAGAASVGLVHIVFEDDTNDPQFITIDARQCDRLPPAEEAGQWRPLVIYTPSLNNPAGVVQRRSLPALIRRAGHDVDATPVQPVPRN